MSHGCVSPAAGDTVADSWRSAREGIRHKTQGQRTDNHALRLLYGMLHSWLLTSSESEAAIRNCLDHFTMDCIFSLGYAVYLAMNHFTLHKNKGANQ